MILPNQFKIKISFFLEETMKTQQISVVFLSDRVTAKNGKFFSVRLFSAHCNACQISFLKDGNDDNVSTLY
jgi:hypothetical protein